MSLIFHDFYCASWNLYIGGLHPARTRWGPGSIRSGKEAGPQSHPGSHQPAQVSSPAPSPRPRGTGPGLRCLDSCILHMRSEHPPWKILSVFSR